MSTTPRRTPGPPPVGYRGYYTQPRVDLPPLPQQGLPVSVSRPPPPPPPSILKKTSVRKNLNFDMKGEEKKEEETMTVTEMKLFAKLYAKAKGTTNLVKVAPRYGGIDEFGPWTGSGQRGQFKLPKNFNCCKGFSQGDPMRNETTLGKLQDKCQLGIQDDVNLFRTSHELNSNRVVEGIAAFQEFAVAKGMEGVFIIVRQDGSTLDMLKTPGMISQSMVTTWCTDLMVDGVHEPQNPGKRLPVCPYDETCLSWSGQALLNSSTLTMKRELKRRIPDEGDMVGPQVFQAIMSSTFRPSQATVKALVEKLEALKLTDYPGESVAAFNEIAIPIIEEIEMCTMMASQVSGLTASALKGLMTGSDPHLKHKVIEKQMACNVNAFDNGIGNQDLDAKKVLGKLQDLWTVMVDLKQYDPALAFSKASALIAFQAEEFAFQAEVSRAVGQEMQALGQQRSASSTTGARSGDRPRRGNCYDCGSPDHYKRDPSCPGKPTGYNARNSNTGSTISAPATASKNGLDKEEATRINNLCYAKMDEFSSPNIIPDGLEIKEGSNVLATWCNKCGRFTKGSTIHTGATHRGRSYNRSAAPAPAIATASGNLGATAPRDAEPRQVGFANIA
jgi:hypothetical protein